MCCEHASIGTQYHVLTRLGYYSYSRINVSAYDIDKHLNEFRLTTRWDEKWGHRLMTIILSNLNRF